MQASDINIRDPFVVPQDGVFYLYGTRAANFGRYVGGFDVYTSRDLIEWSEPHPVFSAIEAGLESEVFWAPEVHPYNGKDYMFATFTQPNGLRGTFSLRADSLMGPFSIISDGALTPHEWECLDGTLYVENGTPYLVFCHEHTQIINGAVCYIPLHPDLTHRIGEPKLLFYGSDPYYIEKKPDGEHYVTDGPFLVRDKDRLLLLWSTILDGKYAECLAEFSGGSLFGELRHMPPLITDDGGHGMIFEANGKRMLTFHSPNISEQEHPVFLPLHMIE